MDAKNVVLLLYTLMFLLSVLLIMEGYNLLRIRQIMMHSRRRWLRIKVPATKAVTCRILEPLRDAGMKEYVIEDLNLGGICFVSDKKMEKTILKLSVRFPFMTYKDAASVWGRVVYSRKLANEEKYRTGVAYIRREIKIKENART